MARTVPAAVWLPTRGPLTRRAVMLGHGGSGDKHSPRNQRLARLLTAVGVIAMAIDGPYHGDRIEAPMSPSQYQRAIIDDGVPAVTARMTADWIATLAALRRADLIDAEPVGYIGVSMGARYGVALAAALGIEMGPVVLGSFGLLQTPLIDPRLHDTDGILRAAQAISAPTLIHVQWDDEVFPRTGQFELFEAIGAHDKRLLAHPGLHAGAPPEAVAKSHDHIISRALVTGTRSGSVVPARALRCPARRRRTGADRSRPIAAAAVRPLPYRWPALRGRWGCTG